MKDRVVRAVFAAAVVAGCGSAWADLSASAYVQDGLIAQWDGIENAGAGQHNASATMWKNLKGDGDLSFVDTVTVGANCMTLSRGSTMGYLSGNSAAFLQALADRKFTAELSVKTDANYKTDGYAAYLHFGAAGNRRWLLLDIGDQNTYTFGRLQYRATAWDNSFTIPTANNYSDQVTAALVESGDGVALLVNGTQLHKVTGKNVAPTTDDFLVGRYGGNKSLPGEYQALRLYNRALTPREAAFNAAIDKIRFTGTAPEGWSEDAGVLKVKVSVSCNPELGKFSVNGGSAVSEYEAWHTLGESVKLVVEGIGYQGLEGWTGNLPADVDRSSREIVVKCDIPMTIGVNFRGVRHVATSGADTEENGTAAAPYRTIQYAVEHAGKGEVVKVAGGVYEEAVVNAVEGLRVEGSYTADFTARDLRNGRTVIKAPTASVDCYKTTGLTNVLSGIDFTGGKYGFRNGCTLGTRAAHKLYQCVFSNNTYGAWCGGYKPNFNCYSCLFYKNDYGTYITGDNGADVYLYHCSFVENAKDAIYREHPYGAVHHIRNCVFVGNGRAINLNSGTTNGCNLYRNLYWNNTDTFRSARGWADQTSYYGNGMFWWRMAPVFMDPALGDDFVPQTGSYAAKAGEDLSATIAEDLYGNGWDGAFDLGCCKTSALSPCRAQSEMYLSPDGDDSNDGADAEHPMKTPAKAFPHLADGATVHFANGTYVGMAAIQANNVKVVGESRDGVILKAHEGEIPANNFDFALGLFGQNPSVANLTFTTSHSGLLACDQSVNYNVDVENCKFTENRVGLMDGILQGRNSSRRLKVSHGIFRNNADSGISIGNTIVADNCLFADNGYYGINGNTWDTSYQPRLNHCTFINNGSYAIIERNSTIPWSHIANCIFYGNGKTRSTAAIKGGSKMKLYSCCFYDNQALYISSSGNPTFTDNITDDPRLNLTEGLKGHLLEGSPCSQSGVNKNSDANFSVCKVTDDLDYIDRNQEKIDVGCYISPETMKELAGHGYHVLTVAGEPEGWGAPNVSYGDNLLKDGTLALSVAEGIETSPFDGVRNYPLGTGVRAAYKGFTYTREGESEPAFSSATDESIAAFTFEANATWKIKWQRQYLVTVSTDAPGCLVRLDDGAPAATVQKWIPEGQSYTVAFVPTDDFQFDGWGAGFPPEGDARYVSTTVAACNGSATFSPVYKSIICVAKSGDDETGNGTAASPFLTIAKAMSIARSRDVIRIQTGLYEESVTNTALNELTIEGGYAPGWTRDLRNAPTTIRPPSNKLPCVYINNVISNVVKGLVLTGGNYGIVAYGPAGRADQNGAVGNRAGCAVRNHRLVSLVITNNVSHGVEGAKVMINGVRVISSLIAFNGGNGANFGGDTTASSYIQNCTVVSNKGYGVTFGTYNYTHFEVRNSIVACNGNIDLHNGHYEQTVGHNCLFREDDAKKTSACSGGYFNIGGNLFRDPQLNADFSLKPTSPCIGAGYDFSNYTPYPELEDLYGQPWNGTYDIGAIKSGVTTEKSDDVYVTDGDDLQLAIFRCNENGTVHVAAGEYAGPVSITTKGIKVIGAGPGKSIIRGVDTGADTDLPSTYAVQLAGTGAVLSGFTLTGAARGGGVLLGMSDYAKRCVVTNCTLTGNKYGVRYAAYRCASNVWYLEPEIASRNCAYHRVTMCRCVENSSHGIYISGGAYCGLIADNCLSAKNGGNGVYAHEGSGSGFWVYDDFYYCTFADNAGVGLQAQDGDSAEIRCYNSIVTGNAKGIKHGSYGQIEMKYSVLAGNEIEKEGGSYSFDHCEQEVAPTFETREGSHAYWPAVGSSAVGVPRALIPHNPLNPTAFEDPIAEPLTDLAGNPRKWNKAEKRVAGCFAFPRNGLLLFVR